MYTLTFTYKLKGNGRGRPTNYEGQFVAKDQATARAAVHKFLRVKNFYRQNNITDLRLEGPGVR